MMFTGDHIIGADSVNYCLLIEQTFFTDYPKYLQSLEKVRLLTIKHQIKKYLVAHSYTLNTEDMVVDALPKVEEYIRSRKEKD